MENKNQTLKKKWPSCLKVSRSWSSMRKDFNYLCHWKYWGMIKIKYKHIFIFSEKNLSRQGWNLDIYWIFEWIFLKFFAELLRSYQKWYLIHNLCPSPKSSWIGYEAATGWKIAFVMCGRKQQQVAAVCRTSQYSDCVKIWEIYLQVQGASYFWALWSFQMFTGPLFQL